MRAATEKTRSNYNFNKGMTMNGEPIIVPKAPVFKAKETFCVPEDILFYAFRYALGRRTYAVAEVASELRAHTPTLSNKTKALIIKEINEFPGEMDPIDQKEWDRVVSTFQGKKPLEEDE